MSTAVPDWHRIAVGASRGTALGRRWLAMRTVHAGGRSEKIEAMAVNGPADGGGYVSANLYRLAAGDRLLPCEMPTEHVLRFLADWCPDPRPSPQRGLAAAAESPVCGRSLDRMR